MKKLKKQNYAAAVAAAPPLSAPNTVKQQDEARRMPMQTQMASKQMQRQFGNSASQPSSAASTLFLNEFLNLNNSIFLFLLNVIVFSENKIYYLNMFVSQQHRPPENPLCLIILIYSYCSCPSFILY